MHTAKFPCFFLLFVNLFLFAVGRQAYGSPDVEWLLSLMDASNAMGRAKPYKKEKITRYFSIEAKYYNFIGIG